MSPSDRPSAHERVGVVERVLRQVRAGGRSLEVADRRVAAADTLLQTDPGAGLRAWTAIDRYLTDHAVLVPVTNGVNWWIASERVGNYQSGGREIGPLLSQFWVR